LTHENDLRKPMDLRFSISALGEKFCLIFSHNLLIKTNRKEYRTYSPLFLSFRVMAFVSWSDQ
jgi:hypothetical protein